MATGTSLHIGVNRVDSVHYGSAKPLKGCENDARSLAAIMMEQQFSDVRVLLTRAATSIAVIDAVQTTAARLQAGDLFVLSYSGHGGQARSCDPSEDVFDETWLLYDRQFLDDELCSLLTEFSEGVRVLILLDSCHSGTMDRLQIMEDQRGENGLIKGISQAESEELWNRHSVYRSIWDRVRFCTPQDARASVIYMSACADDEKTLDGRPNSVYTTALLESWDRGRFTGAYADLNEAIRKSLVAKPAQNPQFRTSDTIFGNQRPFTI